MRKLGLWAWIYLDPKSVLSTPSSMPSRETQRDGLGRCQVYSKGSICVVANIWVVMVRMEHWFLAAPSPKPQAQGKGCIRTGVQVHQGKHERGIQSRREKGKTQVPADSCSSWQMEWVLGEEGTVDSETTWWSLANETWPKEPWHDGPELSGCSPTQQLRWWVVTLSLRARHCFPVGFLFPERKHLFQEMILAKPTLQRTCSILQPFLQAAL